MPSPLIIDSKHNLSQNELVGRTSQSLEAVAEEVMDIFVGKFHLTLPKPHCGI